FIGLTLHSTLNGCDGVIERVAIEKVPETAGTVIKWQRPGIQRRTEEEREEGVNGFFQGIPFGRLRQRVCTAERCRFNNACDRIRRDSGIEFFEQNLQRKGIGYQRETVCA